MIHDNYDPERDAADIKHLVIGLIMGLIACSLITMCTGCTTTQYVPIEHHTTDTLKITKYQRDSIWIHDSVVEKQKGDTVLIEKWHNRWRDRIVHDTLYQSKTDSVPVPYPVEKLVPAELTTWQKLRMNIGTFMIFATLLFAVGWLLKRKFLP